MRMGYAKILYMKKLIFFTIFLLVGVHTLFAQNEEIMIIKPGRETFAHFPSAVIGNSHTLTVFLPEPFIPLKGTYPLAVLLGAGPKQAAEAEAFMQQNKMIVAAVDFQDGDYADEQTIIRFVTRELLPYLETNYPVLSGAENRIIAARGEAGAKIALALLSVPEAFGGVALASPENVWEKIPLPKKSFRALVTGTQNELARAQQALEAAGFTYGTGFALEYARAESAWFGALSVKYFFAPQSEVALTRFSVQTSDKELPLDSGEEVFVRILAHLKNGLTYDYVPSALRISPVYLYWDAPRGSLSVLAGAEAGTVKIRPVVDKPSFSFKIKLKK